MFTRAFISLYILPEVLYVVALSSDKKRIVTSVKLDLPHGLIKNHVVTDTEVFAQVLTKIWKTYKLKEKSVALVIDEFAAFTKLITLPKVPVAEMHEAVLWAMQEYLPDEADTMLFDWKIVMQEESTTDIFVVAARKDTLESYTKSLEKAGLSPFLVEIPSLSLIRLDTKKKKEALIIYEHPHVSLVVFADLGNVLASSVVYGNDSAEIIKTAKKVSTHYGKTIVDRVYYLGESGATVKGLEKAFGVSPETLEMPIKVDPKAKPWEFLVPISLASGSLPEPSDPFSINLLPQWYVQVFHSSQKKVQYWGLILTVTLFVWISFFASLGTYLFLSQSIANLANNTDTTQTLQKREETSALIQKINTTSAALLQIKSLSVVPQEVINLISQLRPEGVSITEYKMDFDAGTIKVTGTAKDRLSLITFKQNVQKSELLSEVDIPISNFETESNLPFSLTANYVPIAKTIPSKGAVQQVQPIEP